MLKRLLSVVLAISLVFGIFTLPLEASQSKPSIKLDGMDLELEDESYINEEGKIMLPLRNVFEELNYEVKWSGKEEKIKILKGSEEVSFKIGDYNTILKGVRTFMPLEFLSNRTNLVIGLDNNQQIIKINNPKENSEEYFEIAKDQSLKTK